MHQQSVAFRDTKVLRLEEEMSEDTDKPTDDDLKLIADDILRQVVCDCGNYRHHGVSWMPEGSGEGLSVAVQILRKLAEGKLR